MGKTHWRLGFMFPHTNPSLIVSSQLAFVQPLRNYNFPRHPIKHVKLNYPVSQDVYLLASWWRTQRAHQWEAYRRATAPSPLSTRRASMKTKEKHGDTHIKAARVVLALDITQQKRGTCSTWQPGNSITASFHTCPRVILDFLYDILWQLHGLWCWKRFPCWQHTAAPIHTRELDLI